MVITRSPTLSTMVDFSARLLAALAHAQRKPEDLQKHLQISYQALKKVLDGASKSLNAENCAMAARYLGVSIYWLATGNGDMLEGQEPPPNVHMVSDIVKPQYQPPWPFTRVTPLQLASLNSHQLCLVEGYIQGLIADCGPQEKSATA